MTQNFIKTISVRDQKLSKKLPLFWKIFLFYLLFVQADFASAQWTRKQDAHYDRGEMATVLYKNKIYLFTGFGIWPNVEPTNEVYDPATDSWALLAPMPAGKAVTHQGLVLVDDVVWSIGGRLTDTRGPLTNEVWIYNIMQNSWSPGPPLIDPATGQPILWGGGGAALVGRTLHVFGGFINNPCANDQDKYHLTLDIDRWLENPGATTWENNRTPLPIKRNHISTTVLGGKIYVLGGQFGHDCGGGQDQRYSHVYNPLTDTWTRLTDLPTVRSHCEASIFPIDGKIGIAGGDGATDKITFLTPEANGGLGSWANTSYELPTNPTTNTNGYIGIAARVVGESLVVTCGKIGNTDPRKETYVRPFARNIPVTFGFTAACFSKTLDPSQKAVLKNLLFTVEGEKEYTLTSNADWLKVTKNVTGLAIQTAVDIEATVDATGLAPGNYTATITATGTGAGPTFASASFCVNLKVASDEPEPFSLRINAGGTGYTDNSGKTWAADIYYKGGTISYKSFDVPGTTDDKLYLQYRFASSGAPFSYEIPVSEAGPYSVKLLLMEPYFKASGARKFNVDLEGQRVLSDFDIFAQHGYGKAVEMTFEGIPVNDGILNILFTSITNNAIISGIEIENASSSNSYVLTVNKVGEGAVTKTPNQDTYLSGARVNLSAAPAAGYRFVGWSGDATSTANPLAVVMDRNKSITATFEAVPTQSTVLVNAGGTGYTDGGGRIWRADAHFTGGVTSTKSFNVAGTTDDPLYLSYRFAYSSGSSTPGTPFSYSIPVSAGTSYTLKLHFIEPYFKASNARVFNVDVEGQRVLTSFDIYQSSGYGRAVVRTFDVSVTDGTLTIQFNSVKNNAVVSAIEVISTTSATATASLKAQETTKPLNEVLVYPNPNPGKRLYIKASGYNKHETLYLSIQDMTGRLLKREILVADERGVSNLELFIEDKLPRGSYFVQIQGLMGKTQTRVVIQ